MTPAQFEAVPNLSEGRDPVVLERCALAISAHARLVHQTSDAVHHRSVFTYFGSADEIFAASLALARTALEEIDLRRHRGAHPRIGAVDVLPIVPLGTTTMRQAAELAERIGTALWSELGIPVFFYGEAARRPERRLLANVRRGEYEGLAGRTRESSNWPDLGDTARHERGGATAVGAREPLIAFNVELATDDVALARRIATLLRERDGGFRTLRALGISLAAGRVQVSMNVTDFHAVPLSLIVATIRRLAAPAGVAVRGCELIGLIPREALREAVHHDPKCSIERAGAVSAESQ